MALMPVSKEMRVRKLAFSKRSTMVRPSRALR